MRLAAVLAVLTIPLWLLSAPSCSNESGSGGAGNSAGGAGNAGGSGGAGAHAGGGVGGQAGGIPGSMFADRMADWSNVGVVQADGTHGIPNLTTVCATVDAGTYGNGTTDATAAIQAAIDGCPDGQVVHLPAGTYLLNGSIAIGKSIVLRGDGPGATKLIQSASIGMGAVPGSWVGQNTLHAVDWTAGYDRATTTITLADTSLLQVGQQVVLDQLNDTNVTDNGYVPLVNPEGNEGIVGVGVNDCASRDGLNFCTDGTHPVPRAMMQIVEVTAINGNQITIDPPVYYTHLATLAPQAFFWDGGNLKYAGIEDLAIDAQYTDASISMTFCTDCWVKGVQIEHIARGAITTFYDSHVEVRDSYFHMNQASAPENYGLEIDDTSTSLFENNILDALAAGIIVSWSSSGNVIAYNYSVNDAPGSLVLSQTLSNHSVHAFMNLWEGNTVPKFVSDAIWGSASHQTLFRNRFSGYMEPRDAGGGSTWSNGNWPIALEAWHRDFNIIGNVLGQQGVQNGYQAADAASASLVGATQYNDTCQCCTCGMGVAPIYVLGYWNTWSASDPTNFDPLTATTLLRWGNFDYFTGQTHWDAQELPSGETVPSDQTLPASLYRGAKPAWFGSAAWPPIGPDVSGMVSKIPAELCYEANNLGSGGVFDPTACY